MFCRHENNVEEVSFIKDGEKFKLKCSSDNFEHIPSIDNCKIFVHVKTFVSSNNQKEVVYLDVNFLCNKLNLHNERSIIENIIMKER